MANQPPNLVAALAEATTAIFVPVLPAPSRTTDWRRGARAPFVTLATTLPLGATTLSVLAAPLLVLMLAQTHRLTSR